tara:strand:+ start:216 stop:488 length:273 start_codon:yes stop_codon:yes gene_type:complete
MIQWMLRKTIWFMGLVYVTLDKFVKYEDSDKILGIKIDDDFQRMTRRELCNYVEFKFGWDEGSFWGLQSTQKIRVCCQVARNNRFKGEEE